MYMLPLIIYYNGINSSEERMRMQKEISIEIISPKYIYFIDGCS
jgi:hypothetical protein